MSHVANQKQKNKHVSKYAQIWAEVKREHKKKVVFCEIYKLKHTYNSNTKYKHWHLRNPLRHLTPSHQLNPSSNLANSKSFCTKSKSKSTPNRATRFLLVVFRVYVCTRAALGLSDFCTCVRWNGFCYLFTVAVLVSESFKICHFYLF